MADFSLEEGRRDVGKDVSLPCNRMTASPSLRGRTSVRCFDGIKVSVRLPKLYRKAHACPHLWLTHHQIKRLLIFPLCIIDHFGSVRLSWMLAETKPGSDLA